MIKVQTLEEHSVCSLGVAFGKLNKSDYLITQALTLPRNEGFHEGVGTQGRTKVYQAISGDINTCALKALFSSVVVLRLDYYNHVLQWLG